MAGRINANPFSPMSIVNSLLATRDEPDYEARVLKNARAVFIVKERLDTLRAQYAQFRTSTLGAYVHEQLYILQSFGLYSIDDLVTEYALSATA